MYSELACEAFDSLANSAGDVRGRDFCGIRHQPVVILHFLSFYANVYTKGIHEGARL